MPEIHLRIDGVPDMVRAFVRMTDDVARAVPVAVRTGVKDGAKEIRQTHRFRNQSGELEKSIQGQVTASTKGTAFGEMVAGAEHASYVEKGTRPHPIHPQVRRGAKGPLKPGQTRRKKGDGPPVSFLRFEWHGAIVFRRSVYHPGTKPNPFMHAGYFKCERVMLRVLEEAIAKARQGGGFE